MTPWGQKTRIAKAVAVIEDACQRFNPSYVFALFSGGGDSRTASYIASLHRRFSGCVHINTGIGIPATRQHVIDTCAGRGWLLKEYRAIDNTKADGTPDPMDYEQIVLKYGFPGRGQHQAMYIQLKERQIARMMREHPGGKVLLISGAREQESDRRMSKGGWLTVDKRRVWLNAIWDWSKEDCNDALAHAGMKPNEAAVRFGRSGECLCGAFARPGELDALRRACPISAARLERLQERVIAAGFPWGWEDSPPDWYMEKRQGQTFMFGIDEYHPIVAEHLCASCHWKASSSVLYALEKV